MPLYDGTYHGKEVAFATMHGKEKAVAAPFRRQLAATITVPVGIDTDALGTFTGEIPRAGTMVDVARAKAVLATEITGLPYGLGSEGSFGPHPNIPFIPRNTEVLVFVDRKNDIEISERLVTHRTNYQNCKCQSGEDISAFLKSIGFPQHAVVVTPNSPVTKIPAFKGMRSVTDLTKAILNASYASSDLSAQIVTDMRAHLNPTRMAVIRALSSRLARRLATKCPNCEAPGFGVVGLSTGLPCGWCGQPTQKAIAKLSRCAKCHFETHTRIPGLPEAADPGHCEHCNP